MPVYKDEKNGSWYAMVRFEDWKGKRKQKCKRGFATKREAQEWERTFQQQNAGDLDMTFDAFCELYEKDVSARSRQRTSSPGRTSCWPIGMRRSSPTPPLT